MFVSPREVTRWSVASDGNGSVGEVGLPPARTRVAASRIFVRSVDWILSDSSGGGGGHKVDGFWMRQPSISRSRVRRGMGMRTYVDEPVRRHDIRRKVLGEE